MAMLQDVRLAFRLLWRTPLPASGALLSIALSIGAAAVVFAAVKAVLLEPLPFARAQELVQLRSEYPHAQQQSHGDWVVANDLREVPRRTRTLQAIGGYHNALFDLAGDPTATPAALYGVLVDAQLFPVLGVSPMRGRTFLPAEHLAGHSDVMLLSYGLWARRFHSDPGIVGRSWRLATVATHAQSISYVASIKPNTAVDARVGRPRMDFD
jgi:putative ABC transport system permease protein